MRSITQTAAPTQQPVSLDELKLRLKLTSGDFDSMLLMYLKSATDYCQEYQWAQYCTATYAERYDRFPSQFCLMRNPVQSISSIVYNDSSGNSQTLTAVTDYTVDIYSKPGRVTPAYNVSWPVTRGHINDVTITYVAGYGTPADVPDEVKQAILLKAAQQYGDCDAAEMAYGDKAIHSLLDKRSFRVFY